MSTVAQILKSKPVNQPVRTLPPQALRTLIRNARKDQATAAAAAAQGAEAPTERKGRAYRELFQQIKSTLAAAAAAAAQDDEADDQEDDDE